MPFFGLYGSSKLALEAITDSYRYELSQFGMMLCWSEIEHTRWIKKCSLQPRVSHIVLGNPLFAITMLREDLKAGLFVPFELLLIEEKSGSTLIYVKPSSLIAIDNNTPLRLAAEALDAKVASLIAAVTEN